MPERALTIARTAAVAVCVLALSSACSLFGGDDDDDPQAGGESSAASRAFALAAPADCIVNAYCATGLADVYGVDIADNLQPKPRIADSVDALKSGEVDLAVVFSASPYVNDPQLTVVNDDRDMVAADNVVPVYRRSLQALYGDDLSDALDDLSALITPDTLAALDLVMSEGADPAEAARDWLDTNAPTTGSERVEGPRLRIGSADFVEGQALAHVIDGYLSDLGYRAKVDEAIANRAEVVDALANGDLDIAPEYTAALLEYLNGDKGEAGADARANYERLADYADLIGVELAKMSSAPSTNVFVTTLDKAEELGLTSLSDLAGQGLQEVTTSPRPGISDAPAELGILVRSVRHQLASGSSGPEVRDVQRRLQELDFDLKVTGDYDEDTIAAVREFQGQQGLAPDGVVRRSTLEALANPKEVEDANPVTPGDPGAADPPGTAGGKKVFYLTFDDGPAETYTKQILALLDKYDAKATFFELGNNASAHPELTKAVLAAGHEVASHTWDHADMTTLSSTALENEITHSGKVLEQIAGKPMTCLRPPYGAVNDTVKAAIAAHDLDTWIWDIDPQDWNLPGVDAIVNNVVSNAHPGAISLMHDGGGERSQSVAALAKILPTLQKQGFTFQALPGC